MKIYLQILAVILFINTVKAQKIIVAQNGTGQFRSIQEAINSLDTVSTNMRTIYIKNGTYREKLFISKSYIQLQGESEKGVIISIALPRDVWRCENPNDFGAATINVKGHDLMLEKLTVLNTYGFDAKGDSTITCLNDTGNKIVRKDGHQFAFRSMPGGIRLSFKNCTFRALGGDTVSPWDVDAGMYYFKDCTMEGGVDFYCPRGWAWAENCRFICHNMNAAIWHDGSGSMSAKTVLKNCTFEGDNGFKLGRFHREAQFYLIDCQFADNMADADIYWVISAPKPVEWGKRVYYKNCHRKGGNDFGWMKDNLPIDVKDITIAWTFDNKWQPK